MKTLTRLLIANRGEIAVRIARTARSLGITTIAVCSDADRDAPHVVACDEHVPIGGSAPAESYLAVDKIVAAAAASRAHAVHPGYGFLAESAAFARAVEAAGLIFVGPAASAIEAMGDKARARRAMSAAGVPVVDGYDGDEQDEQRLTSEAARIGFPIMVKAAAGGGGRGMRLVAAPDDLPGALRSAASEAIKAFGDGRLILERAVAEPRHVEVQVLADAHGNVVHLGERDCSVQRRHQKIVEESPSPAVDPVLRERMGQTALTIARQIGYVGAGTVEFLLDRAGRFHFMEMNTRLQVEHPVTECVAGLDLVELQLRIARGERLPFAQQDVRATGHAIEVRLCAEDPADDFLPCSGSIVDWSPEPLVRCDHAIAPGMTVSPWYDSMLAKVIARGATRAEALDRLAHALDRTVLLGVTTNRSFLARILRHPAFVDGAGVSTAFVSQHFADPAGRAADPDAATWALAAWLSTAAAREAEVTPSGWRRWSNGPALPVPWRLRWEAPRKAALSAHLGQGGRVHLRRDSAQVELDGRLLQIDGRPGAPRESAQVAIDGIEVVYRFAWQAEVLWLHTHSGDYAFRCVRRCAARNAAGPDGGGNEIRAAINGRVVAVTASVGRDVRAGELLVVLDAMKMEHEVRAPRAGRVAAVEVRVGDQVAPGRRLVRIEEETR